jgi:hypothetical protein
MIQKSMILILILILILSIFHQNPKHSSDHPTNVYLQLPSVSTRNIPTGNYLDFFGSDNWSGFPKNSTDPRGG